METPVNPRGEVAPQEVEPAWRRSDQPGALPSDPLLRRLLADRGSLTASLRSACGSEFGLDLISEGLEPSSPEDRSLLGTESPVLHVRRVNMRCGPRLCVCAVTRVPPETLAAEPWLETLGSTPLGDALEARGGMRRLDFEFARAESTQPTFADVLADANIRPSAIWARRSVFTLDAGPLLVYELFLPGIDRCGSH